LLRKVARISSVSGGSITAGALGMLWRGLRFNEQNQATNLNDVIAAVRRMAEVTVDLGAIGWGILLPGSISDRVAKAYDRHLFQGLTLQDLPGEGEGPRFVINATNVQSAVLWRFSRPSMGDYRVGLINNPGVSLATAVAASSAFPPVLSPMTLDLEGPVVATEGADLNHPPYTQHAVLSDGGVYDNLGLETAFKRYQTLLVSDAGQKIAPEEDPHDDWARHSLRVLDLVDSQVRALRKRQLIGSFKLAVQGVAPEHGARQGAYWSVRSVASDYQPFQDQLGCREREAAAAELATTPTRLQAMPEELQERLINWGYAICDIALRRWYLPSLPESKLVAQDPKFPYARGY